MITILSNFITKTEVLQPRKYVRTKFISELARETIKQPRSFKENYFSFSKGQ